VCRRLSRPLLVPCLSWESRVTGRAIAIMTTTSHRPFAVFGRTKISDSNPDPTTVWTVYAAPPLSALFSCDGV
jgi:hypothetical protein